MSGPNLEFLKRQIKRILNRDVEIESTKSGRFICKYVDFNMSPISLIADTEEEAYQKLLQYLKSKTPTPDPETPSAA